MSPRSWLESEKRPMESRIQSYWNICRRHKPEAQRCCRSSTESLLDHRSQSPQWAKHSKETNCFIFKFILTQKPINVFNLSQIFDCVRKASNQTTCFIIWLWYDTISSHLIMIKVFDGQPKHQASSDLSSSQGFFLKF